MPRLLCILTVIFTSIAFVADSTAKSRPPNVVVFLVDDLGYMDIGANNPDCFYETPSIDKFTKTAMRFTNGYAANPVCSPTRYSLMTGKYPTRVRATNFFSGTRSGKFKPAPLNGEMPLELAHFHQIYGIGCARTVGLSEPGFLVFTTDPPCKSAVTVVVSINTRS